MSYQKVSLIRTVYQFRKFLAKPLIKIILVSNNLQEILTKFSGIQRNFLMDIFKAS
jgi:hypothetical protein